MATKKAAKRTTKTKAQWEAEMHEMQNSINEHLFAKNVDEDRYIALAAELAKMQEKLASTAASAARSSGEAEGLKLAMRMLSNTLIGKETYATWAWQAPETK
jgi:hypothetical protein